MKHKSCPVVSRVSDREGGGYPQLSLRPSYYLSIQVRSYHRHRSTTVTIVTPPKAISCYPPPAPTLILDRHPSHSARRSVSPRSCPGQPDTYPSPCLHLSPNFRHPSAGHSLCLYACPFPTAPLAVHVGSTTRGEGPPVHASAHGRIASSHPTTFYLLSVPLPRLLNRRISATLVNTSRRGPCRSRYTFVRFDNGREGPTTKPSTLASARRGNDKRAAYKHMCDRPQRPRYDSR